MERWHVVLTKFYEHLVPAGNSDQGQKKKVTSAEFMILRFRNFLCLPHFSFPPNISWYFCVYSLYTLHSCVHIRFSTIEWQPGCKTSRNVIQVCHMTFGSLKITLLWEILKIPQLPFQDGEIQAAPQWRRHFPLPPLQAKKQNGRPFSAWSLIFVMGV